MTRRHLQPFLRCERHHLCWSLAARAHDYFSFHPYKTRSTERPHLGVRIVSVHVNFLDRRITVPEDRSGVEVPVGSSEYKRIPASKKVIEALPMVEIVEKGYECAICLEEFISGGELAKQMPCEHKYHSGCNEKWLRIHGSCPVCRYEMPTEEGGIIKRIESSDHDEGDDEDHHYFDDVEQGGDSFENGMFFHYLVDGSIGQVVESGIDDVLANRSYYY